MRRWAPPPPFVASKTCSSWAAAVPTCVSASTPPRRAAHGLTSSLSSPMAARPGPTARSAFAPVLPPLQPVAVMVIGAGDRALVRAADASRQIARSGQDALSALAELEVAVGPEPRTLVVPDRDTLSRLLEVGRVSD